MDKKKLTTDEVLDIVVAALREEARHRWDLSLTGRDPADERIGDALDYVSDKIGKLRRKD